MAPDTTLESSTAAVEDTRSVACVETAVSSTWTLNSPKVYNLGISEAHSATAYSKLSRLSTSELGGWYTRHTAKVSSASHTRPTHSILVIMA